MIAKHAPELCISSQAHQTFQPPPARILSTAPSSVSLPLFPPNLPLARPLVHSLHHTQSNMPHVTLHKRVHVHSLQKETPAIHSNYSTCPPPLLSLSCNPSLYTSHCLFPPTPSPSPPLQSLPSPSLQSLPSPPLQ